VQLAVKRRPETDPVRKQRILARAKQAGDDVASLEFNVPKSTIRQWRFRSRCEGAAGFRMPDVETAESAGSNKRVSDARAKADLLGGDDITVEELRSSAKQARRTMDRAIKRLSEVLETAKNPRDIGIAMGILHDKSMDMHAIVQALEERDVRLSASQGELMANVIQAAFRALGVPVDPARRVVRELLGQAGTQGAVLVVSPDVAEEARAAVLEHFARLLRHALPAPLDDDAESDARGGAGRGWLSLPRGRSVVVNVALPGMFKRNRVRAHARDGL
jgi:transposase-like protein